MNKHEGLFGSKWKCTKTDGSKFTLGNVYNVVEVNSNGSFVNLVTDDDYIYGIRFQDGVIDNIYYGFERVEEDSKELKFLEDTNRFDLEQAIHQAWQTEQDLYLIYETTLDGRDKLTEDEIANRLLGLSCLHSDRMNKLWVVFEQLIENGNIK